MHSGINMPGSLILGIAPCPLQLKEVILVGGSTRIPAVQVRRSQPTHSHACSSGWHAWVPVQDVWL